LEGRGPAAVAVSSGGSEEAVAACLSEAGVTGKCAIDESREEEQNNAELSGKPWNQAKNIFSRSIPRFYIFIQ